MQVSYKSDWNQVKMDQSQLPTFWTEFGLSNNGRDKFQ